MKAAFALFLATVVAFVAGMIARVVAGWPLAWSLLALTSSVWFVVYVALLVLIACRAASKTAEGAR